MFPRLPTDGGGVRDRPMPGPTPTMELRGASSLESTCDRGGVASPRILDCMRELESRFELRVGVMSPRVLNFELAISARLPSATLVGVRGLSCSKAVT